MNDQDYARSDDWEKNGENTSGDVVRDNGWWPGKQVKSRFRRNATHSGRPEEMSDIGAEALCKSRGTYLSDCGAKRRCFANLHPRKNGLLHHKKTNSHGKEQILGDLDLTCDSDQAQATLPVDC